MRIAALALVLSASPAAAATIHGLVYDDANGDGKPSSGERGIAHAVVALGASHFARTDGSGQFDLDAGDDTGIVWVRVPEGFTPGPVWARWDGNGEVDLGLRRLAEPVHGPLTFVVASDTHIQSQQEFWDAADLSLLAREAIALDPPPAFFTILGDITQGNQDAEFDLVDKALAGLGVPWIPVPGNHDWYDDGKTWFKRYGPDNYSFDIGGVHFVVWNMAMAEDDIRRYLGAELAMVAPGTTIVALTHAPPTPAVVDTLRSLGVSYLLTGHAHSNRVVDHDGLVELNTEPMLMGGLDFTPAGYRVVTIDAGRMTSYHRTAVDVPFLRVVGPARGQCASASGGELLVAAELDAGASAVTARIDCATPIALRWIGGWTWRAELPALEPGVHQISVDAVSPTGTTATTSAAFEVCAPPPAPAAGTDWPELGGGPTHAGARDRVLAPPLATRWVAAAGGHVVTAAPAIAAGQVFVATTDLGPGDAGGVVALDLATGAQRWRATLPVAVRGGIAVIGQTVITAQIDGVVVGLDAATGAVRWRTEMSAGLPPGPSAIFGAPAAEDGDVLIGHQRLVSALDGATGRPLWSAEPTTGGWDSQSLSAIAVGGGIAAGAFHRDRGGVIAWDRATGRELWRFAGEDAVGINASPVIAGDTVFVMTARDVAFALDAATGAVRWQTPLDPQGFGWGNATIGTPAYAQSIVVVPTLYRDVVALDAISGTELWRASATPSPLRTTHYRGARQAGFAASPVIAGGVVWIADTAGRLYALDLYSGAQLWQTALDVPVLAGLAISGDDLVVASYDGTVRALSPGRREPAAAPASCEPPHARGCCDSGGAPSPAIALVAYALLRRRRNRSASITGHAAAGPPDEHA